MNFETVKPKRKLLILSMLERNASNDLEENSTRDNSRENTDNLNLNYDVLKEIEFLDDDEEEIFNFKLKSAMPSMREIQLLKKNTKKINQKQAFKAGFFAQHELESNTIQKPNSCIISKKD